MLAGDADRERVVEVLKDAFTDGRLTQGEYEERIDRAYRSRTYGELEPLTRDVPRPMPGAPRPGPPPGTNSYALASLVCGIAGAFMVLPAVPAVILGHLARRQMRRTGERGDGMAVGGLVLGYTVCALLLTAVVATVAVIAVIAHA
ncbi:DUF1707 and DUF4190 domain-containing protein [Streptomyces sp. V4-01]|uniref:DUF1707 and DUF4190 domain-containing protein n=1 Tax=Actinacidiphila polyblastidii TaxID=3110430 RepID=A0ABU7P9C6_9ACTN|nr:DUF1707 and DUF4190 domain-containing protein [Streptomyces sp. V4-01]